jgi:glycosyltransferase involved in cell wall biosynthesis
MPDGYKLIIRGEEMPKISIIIPVYNVAPYLRECLDSIQEQTFKDFEAILVDDGSTDGSGEICDWYASKYKRFKVIHKSNGGVSSARNMGLDIAQGEYIGFVDPDDFIDPDFYKRLYSCMIENNADLCISGINVINERGLSVFCGVGTLEKMNRQTGEHNFEWMETLFRGNMVIYESNKEVISGILSNRINCVSWNKLYRRELWGDAKYPLDLSLGEDMATVVNVCAGAERAVYCPDAIYYYRIREKSLLHGTVTAERFAEDLQGSEIMKNHLLERAPMEEDKIKRLKFFYDMGCAINFIKTTLKAKNPGNEKTGKSSVLFSLFK